MLILLEYHSVRILSKIKRLMDSKDTDRLQDETGTFLAKFPVEQLTTGGSDGGELVFINFLLHSLCCSEVSLTKYHSEGNSG